MQEHSQANVSGKLKVTNRASIKRTSKAARPTKFSDAISYNDDGTLPDRYAFYNNQGRSFRTEFASTDNEFSIVLFEKTPDLNYENCFARGLLYDIERVAMVIDLWVNKQKSIFQKLKNTLTKLKPSKILDSRMPIMK